MCAFGKIVIDRDIPYIKGVLEPYFDVEYYGGREISRECLCGSSAMIIRTRTKCNADLLQGTDVKLIATATIGLDHIDEPFCASSGIKVVNAPGCNAGAVLQYFYTALYQLAHSKNIELKGKTIGVIGVGHVGSLVADFGEKLGFKVIRNDPYRAAVETAPEGYFSSLDHLLSHSDIVTLHIPLSHENLNFVDDRFFDLMKEGAIFVNASRGEVLSEEALLEVRSKLSGVVLDVWRGEPKINIDLLSVADIATPHIAGYSAQGKINGTVAVVREVANFFGVKELHDFSLPSARTELDFEGKSQLEITQMLTSLYPILDDDGSLRSNPRDFEQLRSQYKYRIEYVY